MTVAMSKSLKRKYPSGCERRIVTVGYSCVRITTPLGAGMHRRAMSRARVAHLSSATQNRVR